LRAPGPSPPGPIAAGSGPGTFKILFLPTLADLLADRDPLSYCPHHAQGVGHPFEHHRGEHRANAHAVLLPDEHGADDLAASGGQDVVGHEADADGREEVSETDALCRREEAPPAEHPEEHRDRHARHRREEPPVIGLGEGLPEGAEVDAAERHGEYVELYNPGGSAISLAGWQLDVYGGDYTFTSAHIIPARGHFLISDTSPINGVAADVKTNINITDNGANSFARLRNASSTVVDTVGWASSPYYEGTRLGNLAYKRVWRRAADGADSNSNAADFVTVDPDPKNTTSSPQSSIVFRVSFQPHDVSHPGGEWIVDSGSW